MKEPLYAYRTTREMYGKERAMVVTFNPRTYKKKILGMSRTILRTKRKLQEILSESHIAPVLNHRNFVFVLMSIGFHFSSILAL